MYRVFLADDEPWVLLGLRNLIDWGEEGFVICGEATDGVKAWERICRLKPDLIFSDIQMPGMTGIDLIEKLRREELDSEVVLISGYSEFEYARAGMRLGCAEYLLKPVYSDDLLGTLKKIKERLNKKQKGKNEEIEIGYTTERSLAEQMLSFIEQHYQNLTQQQLAQQFCMSASAVSILIKKYTGKNYSAHLLELRIQKAQELLRKTNESIASIAEKVGYNDYFYFVKVFKNATGISPSEFRKRM